MSVLPEAKFYHQIIREGDRTMILSVCMNCRSQARCSAADGSVQTWEESHTCEVTGPSTHQIYSQRSVRRDAGK